MCGETEIPAHVLMTTVNQLKKPAATDEEIDMAQSWVEEDTPTGFQRQFKVGYSFVVLAPMYSILAPFLRYHFVYYCYAQACVFCG